MTTTNDFDAAVHSILSDLKEVPRASCPDSVLGVLEELDRLSTSTETPDRQLSA